MPPVIIGLYTYVSADIEDSELNSDEEECSDKKNLVAFLIYELNMYLKAKDCPYYQVPLYNQHFALTLEQSLLEFTGLDVLDEENKFVCQTCTNNSELRGDCNHCINFIFILGSHSEVTLCRVSKYILIHNLPPILILQMKRFNIGSHNVTKDNRFVHFPHVLDMAPYCTSQCFEV